jgi:hypothetical protein
MRGFQFSTFLALGLLGLAWSTSTALAFPLCTQVTSANVKAGSSFYGAACNRGKGYTTCSCTATFCGEICIPVGKSSITCHGLFSSASCNPNMTVKTP